MTIEVIWGSGSPYAWRVLLTLEVKGLSYESRLIQFSRGDHRSPEHLALNPRGKVPVLRDGDYVLSESLAIMAYLDRKHPEPPLFGRSPQQTGLIWKAISEFECYVWPPAERIVVPAFGIRPLDPADVQAAAGELQGELGLMEEAMSKRDWLAVEQLRRPWRLEAPEWMRVTICCRKRSGRWLVAHEHFSVPFDMESGKALLTLEP